MNREKDKQKLMSASINQEITVAWFAEGGGLVYRLWDVYVLFEVPLYGGKPNYVETFCESKIEDLLDMVYSWT